MSSNVKKRAPAKRDVSGVITGVALRYVREKAGDEGVAAVLSAAREERTAADLEDPTAWSTDAATVALLGAAGRVLGDPEISRHVGAAIVRQYDRTDDGERMRSAGTPAELLGQLSAESAGVMPIAPMVLVEGGDDRVVVEVSTRRGAARRPALCALTKGLLCEVPAVLGLGRGAVVEEQCQARGAKSCRYRLVWGERPGFPSDGAASRPDSMATRAEEGGPSIESLQDELRRAAERLEEVYSTAAELISGEDLRQLLASITRRAAGAVQATRYLLVVRTSPDEELQLHHHGFDEEEARALAEELRHPEIAESDTSRLVVDVASSRRHYGRLAAVFPPGTGFLERERKLFSLYATYAATALDLVTALADSRTSNDTARALLDFSRALSRVGTTEEVCRILAETVPAVVHCGRCSVFLWDPVDEQLVLKALMGPGVRANAAQPRPDGKPAFVVSATDTPVVETLMRSKGTVVVERGTEDPFLAELLERSGVAYSVLCPLFSDDEFLGMVGGDFLDDWAADPRADRGLQERLRALADQAVTAFQNARLLEQVGRLAWHDALTGLPNRRALEDRLRREIERAGRADDRSTVFFVDLDRFKRVNDSCGHAAGDELLCQVAQRLRAVVRRQDTVARLGGDEFAVVLPGLSDMTAVHHLARRMLESLHLPYDIAGTEVLSSASIGIAAFPDHGTSYDELLSHADEAMYRSKAMGRNTFSVFEGYPERQDPLDATLDAELRRALVANELFVLYQPYVDLHTGQVLGVEALIRWHHPTRGVLEAGSFVPQAERSGLVVQIDRLVVEEAVRQLREWTDQGLPPLRMSVNVSRQDLELPDFLDTVMGALHRYDVAPGRLELDVGGRALAEGDVLLHQTIDALRQEGVRLAIDDFDAGSSSLAQLATFPINTVKINRSFLQLLGPTDELHLLISAIVAMAQGLGLECVVGGVETSHQSRVLLQRGASTAQGFYFSPPLAAGAVHQMIDALAAAGAGSLGPTQLAG
ncbi:MAG: EAL domain-containing protein [Acidimicrobiales bacterium]